MNDEDFGMDYLTMLNININDIPHEDIDEEEPLPRSKRIRDTGDRKMNYKNYVNYGLEDGVRNMQTILRFPCLPLRTTKTLTLRCPMWWAIK